MAHAISFAERCMAAKAQRAYLEAAKQLLTQLHPRLTWDRFADLAGISARAFKTYRMPGTSADFRRLDPFRRATIDRLLARTRRVLQRQAKATTETAQIIGLTARPGASHGAGGCRQHRAPTRQERVLS